MLIQLQIPDLNSESLANVVTCERKAALTNGQNLIRESIFRSRTYIAYKAYGMCRNIEEYYLLTLMKHYFSTSLEKPQESMYCTQFE